MGIWKHWPRVAVFGVLAMTLGAIGFRAAADPPPRSTVFVSSTSGGTVGGVLFTDEDILAFDEQDGVWAMFMDGSTVGLAAGSKLDGFHVDDDGTTLFTLSAPANISGLGTVDDSDVIRLDGATSALSIAFDGSDFGLTSAGEDVDAIAIDNEGRLLLSTAGSVSVPAGSFADEDVLRLVDGALEPLLDGSALGLGAGGEDIVGLSVAPDGTLEFTTLGNLTVPGFSAGRSDVVRCEPGQAVPITSCTFTKRWSGAAFGFQAEAMNGLSVVNGAGQQMPTTTTSTSTPPPTTLPPTTTTTLPTTSTSQPTTTTTTTVAQPVVGPGSRFLISTSSGSVDGVSFTDEDVMMVDDTGRWSLLFDGSDVGLTASQKLDGVAVTTTDELLLSLAAPASLPGLGSVDDSDVVRFEASSLGSVTAGTFSMVFDGSANGLGSPGEDVDAVGLDRAGNLLISTRGTASGPFGVAADEDVLVFDGTDLSLYLDGSAVGLASASEDIVGVSAEVGGVVQLATIGNHSVAGAGGDRSDTLLCHPITRSPITECVWVSSWDGGLAGFGAETIGGMSTMAMVGYYTDFSEPLGNDWEIYNSIGHAGWGLRRPSAVAVVDHEEATSGGLLTITAQMGTGGEAGQLVSGGIKLKFPQTYGNYVTRVRVEPDPDGVTSGAVLLWPESNQNPRDGEIDILESWSNRETRIPVESNLHWLRPGATPPFTSSDDLKAQVVHPGVDGTVWHVFTLEWREDLVSVSVDGDTPVVLSTDPAEIASWNMEPTIQLDAFDAFDAPGVQPAVSGPVIMYVDYLIIRP